MLCLNLTNDYFIVRELSVNSWNLTKGGWSMCLGDSPSCRQSRHWTKLSCSYLCCELRDPSQVTLTWKTIHTNSPNHLFLWAWWKVCFISHTRLGWGGGVVWLLKCFAALIDFDVFSQYRWKQMAKERANGETCQSRESSKKTKWRPGYGRGGNPWASQEAAAFLRLGQEKRRPLLLMPQTKAWNNLLVKNSSSGLNQRPVVHNGRLGALVCCFKVNNHA